MKNLLISLLILLLSTDVLASYVAVLETGADGDARNSVSLTDRQFLTNVLREEAVKQLPAIQNYTIMTRENIQRAEENARTQVEALFRTLGYKAVRVEIQPNS